jgi:hypothetical protein
MLIRCRLFDSVQSGSSMSHSTLHAGFFIRTDADLIPIVRAQADRNHPAMRLTRFQLQSTRGIPLAKLTAAFAAIVSE